jgi:tagatose 1,6-diphosphate aldolase
MIHSYTGEELGEINLRDGSGPHIEKYAGHVGFTVRPGHQGNRYAARALGLLIPLARKLGIDPLWITADPGNIGSRRSCEIAGAKFVEMVDVPPDCVIHRSGHARKCRYRLDLGLRSERLGKFNFN